MVMCIRTGEQYVVMCSRTGEQYVVRKINKNIEMFGMHYTLASCCSELMLIVCSIAVNHC